MSLTIQLNSAMLTTLHKRDPRLLSYNIEMTELMGGTFWKPYTPEQVSGEEEFPRPDNQTDLMALLAGLHIKMPEIDLYEPRLRTLAKALGPAIVRYSGSWATCAYYDFDGHTGGRVPDGFDNVLTKKQWQGALDFAKAVGAKILVSVANCVGVHKNGVGQWMPDQAALLWDYAAKQGVTIDYAEFANEPNFLTAMKAPEGYGPKEFARDHDLFATWLMENHPETTLVGPCAADAPRSTANGFGSVMKIMPTEDFICHMKITPPIFSYHSYTGISERGQFFGYHYQPDQILTEAYLGATMEDLDHFAAIRDQYVPSTDLWVTESADAGCGGNTWASTFVETIRFVDELCRFAANTKGVIFHNTLASSAYGLLSSETHQPRPQYWGGLLFNTLVGEMVYDTHEPIRAGVHLYAFSRKDGEPGACYVYINNSETETVRLEAPACVRYTLSSDKLRSQKIFLNGRELVMPDENTMPDLSGENLPGGTMELAPCTVSFLVV